MHCGWIQPNLIYTSKVELLMDNWKTIKSILKSITINCEKENIVSLKNIEIEHLCIRFMYIIKKLKKY